MRLTTGQEAIAYMGPKHPMVLELYGIIESVIQFKEKVKDKPPSTACTQIRKYIRSNKIFSQIATSIYKHTNIPLNVKLYSGGLTAFFGIYFEPSDNLTDSNEQLNYTRFKPQDFDELDQSSAEKFVEKLRSSIDRNDGKVTNVELAKQIIGKKFVLHFCIDTAFCSDIYNTNNPALMTEEIITIILHELGHLISILDYVNLVQKTVYELAEPVRYNGSSEKEAKKVAAAVRKKLQEAKKTGRQ